MNPFDAISLVVDTSILSTMGSSTTIKDPRLMKTILELGSILKKLPVTSEKNGRTVQSVAINGGELSLYSTKEQCAILGNHASGGGRSSIAIVLKAPQPILIRWASFEEPQRVVERRLYDGDVAMIHAGEIHALLLHEHSEILLFTNRLWAPPLPLPPSAKLLIQGISEG